MCRYGPRHLGAEDYWAPILGSLTLIRSSNIPNIDDTAWESVEEEGRGQGENRILCHSFPSIKPCLTAKVVLLSHVPA